LKTEAETWENTETKKNEKKRPQRKQRSKEISVKGENTRRD